MCRSRKLFAYIELTFFYVVFITTAVLWQLWDVSLHRNYKQGAKAPSIARAVCTTNMPGYALPQENSGFRTQNVFFICKNGKKAVSLRRRKYDCVY